MKRRNLFIKKICSFTLIAALVAGSSLTGVAANQSQERSDDDSQQEEIALTDEEKSSSETDNTEATQESGETESDNLDADAQKENSTTESGQTESDSDSEEKDTAETDSKDEDTDTEDKDKTDEEAVESMDTISFPDVSSTDWFYEYVQYVAENGLMTGYDSGSFGANDNMTRGQFVTVLYRMTGSPKVYYSASFSDVESGTYYYDPVIWAAENGIVTGYSTGGFGPNDNITREQLVTILYRYAKCCGADMSGTADYSSYPDAESVSSYATTAMSWAVGQGVISGANGYLVPQDNSTRAVCATIIARVMKLSFSPADFQSMKDRANDLAANNQAIEEGIYTIQSAIDTAYNLDVAGGSYDNSADIQLYTANTSAAQKWKITKNSKGYYTITALCSGKVMDVAGGSMQNGTNITQYDSYGNTNQKWIISQKSDGSCYLISAANVDYCAHVSGATAADGQSIVLYKKSNVASSRFYLTKERDIMDDSAITCKGTVKVDSKADILANYKIKISSVKTNATVSQIMVNTYTRGDASDLSTAYYAYNGKTLNLSFTAPATGKYFIQVVALLDGSAMVEIGSGTVTVNNVLDAQQQEVYSYCKAIYEAKGYDLYQCFIYCVNRLSYKEVTDNPGTTYTDTEYYALWGFKNTTGDCRCFAGMFYWLAKFLGYDPVYYAYGYIPSSDGGWMDHAWVEIEEDGSRYIYDPNFQEETQMNGYHLVYGTSGTLMYTNPVYSTN